IGERVVRAGRSPGIGTASGQAVIARAAINQVGPGAADNLVVESAADHRLEIRYRGERNRSAAGRRMSVLLVGRSQVHQVRRGESGKGERIVYTQPTVKNRGAILISGDKSIGAVAAIESDRIGCCPGIFRIEAAIAEKTNAPGQGGPGEVE